MSKPQFYFGIDTGTTTGLAIWHPGRKALLEVKSMLIHQAMAHVQFWRQWDIFVRVEDARLATFGRQQDKYKLKGAGSVMRDAKIWEDFLTDLKVPFEMVRPMKQFTKLSDVAFRKITGWSDRTSNHARDAAMLVFGL